MEEYKQEIETVDVLIDIKNSAEGYTITSVLDELEGVLDSLGDKDTKSFDSIYLEEEIPSGKDEIKSEDISGKEILRKGIDLSCQDCVFRTNSENILNLHTNYKHGTNLPVKQITHNQLRNRQAKHKRVHINKSGKLRTCNLCSVQTLGLRNMQTHFRTEHKGENVFKCDVCDYGSNWPVNLRNHKESVHEQKTYQCDLCEHKSKWKVLFLEHQREAHGIFAKVTKFSHGKKIMCDLCDYEVKNSKMLQTHKSNNHGQGTRKAKSERSRKTIVKNVKQTYHCDICSYIATRRDHLKSHKEREHPGIDYPCDLCSYVGKKKRYLICHKIKLHKGKDYPCELCSYVGKNKAYLSNHNILHHKEKQYQCDQCLYKAGYKYMLTTHTKSIHGGKIERTQ